MEPNRTTESRCVTLAAAGDVSTGHTPPASAFAYVTDALRAGDIRFAQVERLYTYCSVLLPQSWATDERAGCVPMRAPASFSGITPISSRRSKSTAAR